MNAAVLLIGGMDSSGGAGLLRDAATLADCGVAARVAVTAVTAQGDRGVTAIHPVPPQIVADQIAAAGRVGAVKIGMLASAEVVAAVVGTLPAAPRILDPVLRASSGRVLTPDAAIARMIAALLPGADLITPNRTELSALARHLGQHRGDETSAAAALLGLGCRAVLVKGGHDPAPDISEDRLYLPGQPPIRFAAPRVAGSLRGTGCQLASAIAAHVARGDSIADAVGAAKAMVQRRFQAAAPD